MSLFTSTHFASACASGTDWRDTSKNILEKLEDIRTENDQFNFGFLYISDHLVEDTASIYNLFKSVLKIDNWIGSIGMGVIGCGETHVDTPAISAMIGHFDEDSFCIFPDDTETQENVLQWLKKNTPMLSIVHGDPMADRDPQELLKEIGEKTDSFLVGGLSSSRHAHYQIANRICENAVCGALFSNTLPVSTALSQGCQPISAPLVITKTDDNIIMELDDQPALDVLQNILRQHHAQKTGKDVEIFTIDLNETETSDHIPGEFKTLFQGNIHAAFPFNQSDQNDYIVRGLTGIYAQDRSLAVSEDVHVGQALMFVERDTDSMIADLSQSLNALKKRVMSERKGFEPKAALYISCIARGFSNNPHDVNEMSVIHDIIGSVPLTGFYAGGEINNARLYGFTGILVLFF